MTPVFKGEYELSKGNHCLVSVLFQINLFFKSKFSSMLTGFRKNHSRQNALLNMTEKWKHLIKANIGIIFMDLSKSFDTLEKQFTIYYLPNQVHVNRISQKPQHTKFPTKYE